MVNRWSSAPNASKAGLDPLNESKRVEEDVTALFESGHSDDCLLGSGLVLVDTTELPIANTNPPRFRALSRNSVLFFTA